MVVKTNQKIRETAKLAGVRFWRIAERVGISDGNFSRMLRHELPREEQEKILAFIDELAKEER